MAGAGNMNGVAGMWRYAKLQSDMLIQCGIPSSASAANIGDGIGDDILDGVPGNRAFLMRDPM